MVVRGERPLTVTPDWLADDTEASIVGTEWHQEAIWGLAEMLREVFERRGAPWGVCEQIELGGLRHHDGRPYAPKPDVMVLRIQIPGYRSGIHLNEAGTPLFIAETASASTVRGDREGKRIAYAAIGIPEYMIFDPSGEVLGREVEAWRLPHPSADSYEQWEPGADGWWHSHSLAVSLRDDGPLIAVRDRDGTPIESARAARRALRSTRDELGAARSELNAVRNEADAAREELRAERAAREALEEQIRQLRANQDE